MTNLQRQTTKKGQPKLLVTDPEYTLSIIGLIASFCGQPIVGLVLSIIAIRRSKAEERANIYALLALIFSIIQIALTILIIVFYFVFIFAVLIPQFGGHQLRTY